MAEEDIVTPQQKLTRIVEKIIPIAEILSAKLLRFAIFITLVSIWIGVFCYQLNNLSVIYTGILVLLSFIPAAIFYLYYFLLQDVVDVSGKIPNISVNLHQSSKKIINNISQIKNINREQLSSFNLIGLGKKIFELLKLIYSGKEMLDQYINISFLINPISWILLSSALFGLAGLTLVFIVTLIVAIV
jgi:hypothetical protein